MSYSIVESCGPSCGDHILGKEKPKPVAKDTKRDNRKRKKSEIRNATRKYRRANDGSRKPAAYAGPRIEKDFDGWLESSKEYQ